MSYDSVQGGKLRLKGSKPKSKKKRERKEEVDSNKKLKKDDEDLDRPKDVIDYVAPIQKTKAELAYEKLMKQREKEMVKKGAEKSHRKKIEDFNKYLASLSEHHDIPKVGPG